MRLGATRFFNTSEKSKKRGKLFLLLLIFTIMISAFFWYSFCVLRPTVISLAKAKANEIGVMTINRAVSEKLKSENLLLSDVLNFTYDENGKITSLSSNVSNVTALKSDLALQATEAIKEISKSSVGITLGSLSGIDILYGTGPIVPIHIRPYGYATTDIETRFHEEGINQTAFEIVAKISADVSVLMPTISKSEKITTSVPLISAVIVGDVPESYTNVDRDGQEYEDDVLQLAE